MESGLPLFDHAFKQTRRESWHEKQSRLVGQKARVFAFIEAAGDAGATIAEIAAALAGGHSNRVTQAVKDLRAAELIRGTDERRSIPGGKASVVLKVNRQGVEHGSGV